MKKLLMVGVITGIVVIILAGVFFALKTWYPDALMKVLNVDRVNATPVRVGKECIGCHPPQVAHVASGSHANVSCDVCHQGIEAHKAAPNDPAKYAEAVFNVEHCAECHEDRYEKWTRYVMEQVRVEVPVEVTVEKEVHVVKEVPVTTRVEVSVTKEVATSLSDWSSPAELKEFLAQDDTNEHVFLKANAAGDVKLVDQCEDYALQLRDRAMERNRFMSIIALSPDEYLKWYGKSMAAGSYHAICMARIGNEFWYIEPTNDKAWLALYLD